MRGIAEGEVNCTIAHGRVNSPQEHLPCNTFTCVLIVVHLIHVPTLCRVRYMDVGYY
jgi:hypothetical protein